MTQNKTIYIANTGGTIGMRRGRRGYETAPGFLAEQMAAMPEFTDRALPRFVIEELKTLLDSTNMCPADWVRIGQAIARNYDRYDGFIVIHGTDTMAYSASALSFMFENLGKPVVFTGAQIPLVEARSDGRENLITSLLIAAGDTVPEVGVYFGDSLFRGNRTTKVSSTGFRAFASPNLPPLGRVGVRIKIDRDLVRPLPTAPFRCRTLAQPEVADLRLFPGITADLIRRFLQPPLAGAVLHTYGAGNAPNDPALLRVLRDAVDRGVVLVNCTQCLVGSVAMDDYATGNALRETGVISGFDMTPEAALTKLFSLLSGTPEPHAVRQRMQQDLRGELTRPTADR